VRAPSLPRPPPDLHAVNRVILPAGSELHRTHAHEFGPAAFNPCQGQATRFAPIQDAAGGCVPSLYAATSREAAAFESIFHDIEPAAPFKTVRLEVVTGRSVSRIAGKRPLRLAALFTPDLAKVGRTRTEVIDTPKSTYGQTARWAEAIHRDCPDVDGLIWTSRQCDPERCVLLFGDRVGDGDFDVLERRVVAGDPDLLMELREFGRRAAIVIVN
jgi:hypothetical protein